MSYTQDQLDRLKRAYASGLDYVQTATGERMQYRSRAEMKRVIEEIEAELTPARRRRLGLRLSIGKGA